MPKYLTRFGIAAIREKIAALESMREEALASAGQAAQNDPNSYHDNFEYEEGMRQQEMCSQQLRGLHQLLDGASVAPEPADCRRAAIGHYVLLRREGDEEDEGYLLCGAGEAGLLENACSETSPLGQALLGMAAGESKRIELGSQKFSIRVLEIRVARDGDVQSTQRSTP